MEPMLADAHYAMLERLIDGVNYYECSEEEKESIRHLDGIKMCRPRANVQRGLYKIEPLGRAALDAYRKDKFYKKKDYIILHPENPSRHFRPCGYHCFGCFHQVIFLFWRLIVFRICPKRH